MYIVKKMEWYVYAIKAGTVWYHDQNEQYIGNTKDRVILGELSES